jgi:hypothetical protein
MSEKLDRQYYTSQDIAELTNFSVRWVVKWRHKIYGARREGRVLRFDRAIIDAKIAKGAGIVDYSKK